MKRVTLHFSLILCIVALICNSSYSREERQLKLQMKRTDYWKSLSFTERFRYGMERSKNRSADLTAAVKQASLISTHYHKPLGTALRLGQAEFIVTLGVGTPGVSFDAVVDTGSDLTWTQCKPCKKCFQQRTPIFDPSKSSTYDTVSIDDRFCHQLLISSTTSDLICNYNQSYMDGSYSNGVLSYDTLDFVRDGQVEHFAFGCGQENQGEVLAKNGGVMGLGRGPLSLVSQLGPKLGRRFSYCLLSINDSPSHTSPLYFGGGADLQGDDVKSVKLLRNRFLPHLYYVPATKILVAGKKVDIPPGVLDLKMDGSGGMIVDSGTTYTTLPPAAYYPLVEAIKEAVNGEPIDGPYWKRDLCYELPPTGGLAGLRLPALSFIFEGDVHYHIPRFSVFAKVNLQVMCLAISKGDDRMGPAVLGNMQQQNLEITFDLEKDKLFFGRKRCSTQN